MFLAKVKSLIWLIMKLPFFTGPLRCQDMWYPWDGWCGNGLWSEPQLLYHRGRWFAGCLHNGPRARYLKLREAISRDELEPARCCNAKGCPARTLGSPCRAQSTPHSPAQAGGGKALPRSRVEPRKANPVCTALSARAVRVTDGRKKACEKPVRERRYSAICLKFGSMQDIIQRPGHEQL